MLILILRTLIIYLVIIAAMRLMGKRQLGELQPSELVSTILISNLASISIESPEVPLAASLVPVLLIVAMELLLSAASYISPKFARLISGNPVVVIRDGKVNQKTLRELRFSVSDLMEALRSKDVFDPSDVSYAMVETNGSISVCRTYAEEPPTRKDLAMHDSTTKKPTVPFVMNGEPEIMNLRWCKKESAWLETVLQKEGCALSEVLLLLGNDGEDYSLIKKEQTP